MSAVEVLRSKVLQRDGKSGLRVLIRTIRGSSADVSAIRSALRDAGIYVSDTCFSELIDQFAKNGVVDRDKLVTSVIGKLPSRRDTVLSVTTEKLDSNKLGVISAATIRAAYDVSRHPEVLARRRGWKEVSEEFLAQFSEDVSTEEFVAYYAGVSQFIADDKDFDLLLIRSWSLDRPKVAPVEDSQWQPEASKQGQSNGKEARKQHPLYQTSASGIGVRLEHAETEKNFNRTAIFTKYAPPPAPGSGLNTAATRTRV